MTIETLKEYGWLGVFLLWLGREAWPFMRDIVTQERKAKMKTEEAERERRNRLEERQVAAIESIAKVLPAMSARIEHLERASEATLQTVTKLSERVNWSE